MVLMITMLSPAIALADYEDSCTPIVKACEAGGFEGTSEYKKFWKDCMEPILLGEKVKNVNVSDEQAKTCREKKINELQDDLKKLQAVK